MWENAQLYKLAMKCKLNDTKMLLSLWHQEAKFKSHLGWEVVGCNKYIHIIDEMLNICNPQGNKYGLYAFKYAYF